MASFSKINNNLATTLNSFKQERCQWDIPGDLKGYNIARLHKGSTKDRNFF